MDNIYTTRNSEVCDAMSGSRRGGRRRIQDTFQPLNNRNAALGLFRNINDRTRRSRVRPTGTDYYRDFQVRYENSFSHAEDARRYAMEQMREHEPRVARVEEVVTHPRWRHLEITPNDVNRMRGLSDGDLMAYLARLEIRQGRIRPENVTSGTTMWRSVQREPRVAREERQSFKSKLLKILRRTSDLNLYLNKERDSYTAEFLHPDGKAGDYVAEDIDDLLDNVLIYLDAFDRGEEPEYIADTSGSEELEAETVQQEAFEEECETGTEEELEPMAGEETTTPDRGNISIDDLIELRNTLRESVSV